MSNGQRPMVGARVPHSWKEQIQSICRESGKSESEVVQEAIAQYLGVTDASSVVSLSKRVAALERQYQKLVKLM
ncbi:MAG: ribbon-helix-helix protein, CopG family [Elainellaceae cyanobacterium]